MSQFTVDNADNDGSTVYLPASGGFELDRSDNTHRFEWYVHIDNGYDVDVDVTIEGTHYQDPEMNSPAIDGATETVSSGGVDFFNGTTGHSFIRLEVVPAADPTSGSLTVTFQKRRA